MKTDTKHNVPTLRFPEFSGGWTEKKFGEIISLGKEKYNPTSKRGDVKCVDLEHIESNSGILLGYSNASDSKSSKTKFSQGDILYGKLRPYLKKYHLAKFDGVCTTEIWVFKPRNTDSHFLTALIQTQRFDDLANLSSGSKMPRAEWQTISKGKAYTPSPKEQDKIATFLSAVDARIGLLKKKKEQLEAYKRGAMQQIFSCQVRFKDLSGKDYPDWEKTRLGKIGKFISGVGFPEKEQNGKLGIPFFKVSDMNLAGNEHFMTSANNYVTNAQIENYKYKVIKNNAIIFAKVGAAIFQERKRIAHNFLIDNNMMAFIPNVNIMFAKQLFETITLSRYAQVGALPSYNASDLSIFKVEVPCPEEQQKIADFLSAIDKKIELCEKQIADTEKFKKGLLQQMFV